MNAVKRNEIIADEQEMDKILEGLDRIGVPGYTVVHNVTGKSFSATRTDDLPITGLSNVYVLCFCSQDLVESIVTEIHPIINKFGGVCYVSDAMEIKSMHSVA